MKKHKPLVAIALAMASALGASAHAAVLYSSTAGGATSYYTYYGEDPTLSYETPFGDDYNVGYKYSYISQISFYGGDTDPYSSFATSPSGQIQYGIELQLFNNAGTRVAATTIPVSDCNGIGYHTISSTDLGSQFTSTVIVDARYFTLEPFYYTVVRINSDGTQTTWPAPASRPQFTLGFGTAPTVGANDPTVSAQINASGSGYTVVPAAYAVGGDATQQYGAFEVDGTGFNISGTSPLWSATGSGTWGSSSNWTYGTPNGSTYTANLDEGVTANTTVTLDTAYTLGTLNFDNPYFSYTIAGSSANNLTLNASSGPGIINSWNGSHAITAPVIYGNGLTVTTFADPSSTTPSLTLPLSTTATGTLTKMGVGTLAFAPSASGITTLNLPGISIAAGTLALQSNSNHANRTLLYTSAVSITGGVLDLGNNDLDLAGGGSAGLSLLNSYVASGFNGGGWNGVSGIISKAAATDSKHLTALGVIQNNQSGAALYGIGTTLGMFDGMNPGAGDVLVKYTYYGDANLDGRVDGSDYTQIDNGFNNHLTGWLNGDFNYDGVVDGSDYTLIDNAFNTQTAQLSAEIAPITVSTAQIGISQATSASVPEPSTIGLMAAAVTGLIARRRRNP